MASSSQGARHSSAPGTRLPPDPAIQNTSKLPTTVIPPSKSYPNRSVNDPSIIHRVTPRRPTTDAFSKIEPARQPSQSNPSHSPRENWHMRQLLSKPASSDDRVISRPGENKVLKGNSHGSDRADGVSLVVHQQDHEDYSFLNLASPITPALSPCPSLVHKASTFEREQEQELVSDRRTRNVLRRKPSSRTPAPEPSQTLKPPSYTSPAPSAPSSRSPSRSGESDIVSRQQISSSEALVMTPARELILAYKQKERLHTPSNTTEFNRGSASENEDTFRVHGNVPPTEVESVALHPMENDHSYRSSEPSQAGEKEPLPYYTILGSTSGRVVAVGGPEDAWSSISLGSTLTASLFPTSGHSSSRQITGDGISKTLTRKISARWRKSSFPTELNGQDASASLPALPNRPSLQERRVPRAHLDKGPSLRTSLDNHSARPSSHQTKSPGSRSVPESSSFHSSSDTGLVHNQPRSRKSEPGGRENASKIWKLMKRISTGALRETSYSQRNDLPPVPALPKDYQKRSFEVHSRDVEVSKPSQSRSSSSTRAPKLGNPLPPLAAVPTVPSQPSSSTPTTHRPSTTTRSSSPVSSDVASSKFFHKSHSARSSLSSLGEEILPPVPAHKFVPQHIVSPSELHKLGGNEFGIEPKHKNLASMGINPSKLVTTFPSTSSADDWMIVRSPPDELMPLGPFPRHIQRRPPPSHDGRPPSPIIPEFSTTDPINAFVSKKVPGDQKSHTTSPSPTTTTLPPPPRPSRSPRRPSPTVSASSSRVTSPVTDSVPASSRIPTRASSVGQNVVPAAKRGRRMSASFSVSSSPAKSTLVSPSYISPPGSALPTKSAPTSPSDSLPSTRSRMTFRELSEQRHARTEKEKNAMWEDLLERSDRAGGTLHLTGSVDKLPSDQLRFSSAASEILL